MNCTEFFINGNIGSFSDLEKYTFVEQRAST